MDKFNLSAGERVDGAIHLLNNKMALVDKFYPLDRTYLLFEQPEPGSFLAALLLLGPLTGDFKLP